MQTLGGPKASQSLLHQIFFCITRAPSAPIVMNRLAVLHVHMGPQASSGL